MYKKILLAIDDSDNVERVAYRALEIQKQFNSQLVIFHSIEYSISEKIELSITPEVSNWGTYVISTHTSKDIQQAKESKGRNLLMNIKNLFERESIPIETRLISNEPPEEYIKKSIIKENFDLVILGCKGHHSKIKTGLFGNTAQNVLNNAVCDVLIVR